MTKQAQTNGLKNQLASQQQNGQTPSNNGASPYRKLEAYLEKMQPQIKKSLPKTGVTPERLTRIALTSIKQNPQLLDSDYNSLLGAIMESAQAGLIPNYQGSCYLIPYYDRKAQAQLVRFEIGFRGMIEIMTRSGKVKKVVANAVYEADDFHIEYGLREDLKHIPSTAADRGGITHFYAYAPLANGEYAFTVMSVEQVMAIRDRHSQAFQGAEKYNKTNSPWHTDFEAMGKKTVIRQLYKMNPASDEEAADILAKDGTVKRSFDGESERIEVEAYEVEETAEHPQESGEPAGESEQTA